MVVLGCVDDARNWDGRRGNSPSLWRRLFNLQEPGESDDGREVRCGSEGHPTLLPFHLSVSSSTRCQSDVTSYRLRMDPEVTEGSPLIILKKKVTPKPPDLKDSLSGTHVTIDHVTGDLSHFVPRVKEYISRLTALTPPFHLLIQIQDEPVLDYVCFPSRVHA